MGKRGYAAALLTTIALLCTPAPGAYAAPPTDTSALREAVTVEGVREHQQQFQDFANLGDGTREASTEGYKLSAYYVADLMDKGRLRRGPPAVRVQLLRRISAAHRRRHIDGIPVYLRRR